MLINQFSSQRGISLIEILVALAIGLGLLSAAATMALTSLKSSKDTLSSNAAQQELQTILTTVTREIRRAGYRSPPTTSTAENAENTKATTTFRKAWTFNSTNCFVYRFDRNINADRLLPPGNGVIELNEVRGIRLDTSNNRIDFLTTATDTGTPSSCSGAGTWSPLTSGKSIKLGTEALKLEYTTSWLRAADNAIITTAQANTANGVLADSAVLVIDQVKVTLTGELPDSTESNPKKIEVSEMVQLRNRPFKIN